MAAILLLAAFALYLPDLGADSLWFDEAWSAYAAAQPDVIAAANADATNPPLYYALLHLFSMGAGVSEFALRFFSLLLALLAGALAARFARRLFRRDSAGMAALAFTLLLPLMGWATHEARMYTLLAALILVSAGGLHTLFSGRGGRWGWAALLGAELALLYAHNTGPVVALWLNLAVLISWLSTLLSLRAAARLKPHPVAWFAGQGAVLLLWSPYFVTRFLLVAGANNAVTSAPVLSPDLLADLWRAFWQTPWERVARGGTSPLWDVLAALGGLALAFAVVFNRRQPAMRWLVFHLTILIGGIVAALIALQNEMHGRYLVVVAPLLAVLLAGAVVRLPRVVQAGLVVLLAALALVNLLHAGDPRFLHDDARGMARYYAERLDEDDTVIAWSYADRYDLAYYWPREGVSARRVTLPEGADLAEIAPALQMLPRTPSSNIALNVWYTQRADYRGMMNCLLADGTTQQPETYTVNGMTSVLYHAPPLQLPRLGEASEVFTHGGVPLIRLTQAATVGATTAAVADSAACLPMQIEMETSAPMGDLKAALIVRNAPGMEIAQTDAIFATADQRTTAQLTPGERATAFPTLRLPYGTAAGRYSVYLRVYEDGGDPSGLVPEQPDFGRDVLLGMWQVEAGSWAAAPQSPDLPSCAIELADIRLLGCAVDPAREGYQTGELLRVTLLWERLRDAAPPPRLTLRDQAGQWAQDILPMGDLDGRVVREWREVQIPPDAGDGQVVLMIGDVPTIPPLTVVRVPFLDQLPDSNADPVGVWPGIGTLFFNADALATPVMGQPYPVSLIWQAGEMATPADYTVFVQLVDANGQVVAQSDQTPAGSRPTTGWRAGEYILDEHLLTWNSTEASTVSQPLTLIAGLYDRTTMQRVLTTDGEEHVTLDNVTVLYP